MLQLAELESGSEQLRQELSRMRSRGGEQEEQWRVREQELVMRLEDARCRERKLEDQRHNLEVCLADATQQIQELKVKPFQLKQLVMKYIYRIPFLKYFHHFVHSRK